jgi:hypothetical protein
MKSINFLFSMKRTLFFLLLSLVAFPFVGQKSSNEDDFWNDKPKQKSEKSQTSSKDDFWNESNSSKKVSKPNDDFWNDAPTHNTANLEFVYRKGFKKKDDKSNNILLKAEFDDARPFSNGLCAVKLDKKWGFINEKGQLVIPCIYDEVKVDFLDGIAKVRKIQSQEEVFFKGTHRDFKTLFVYSVDLYLTPQNTVLKETKPFVCQVPVNMSYISLDIGLERHQTNFSSWEEKEEYERKWEETRREAKRKKEIIAAQDNKDEAVFKQLEQKKANDIKARGYTISADCKN